MNEQPVVAIVGPTASGKTALSIDLAKRFNGEVVCCDSRTVYRFMDIGTAKPTVAQKQGIAHHMLDLVNPDQQYTVAQYARQARQVIASIHKKGGLPIVCGGTGFYFAATLEGLVIPEVAPDADLRQYLNELADKAGNTALHTRLAAFDPVSADRIHTNDRFRMVRALEVYHATGRPFSQLARREAPPYHVLWIALGVEDRSILREAIRLRLDAQMENGLITEVTQLYNRYGNCNSLLNTINYSEFVALISGDHSLEQARQLCLKNNYQFARRQIIWFRRNQQIRWFFIDRQDPKSILSSASDHIEQRLEQTNNQASSIDRINRRFLKRSLLSFSASILIMVATISSSVASTNSEQRAPCRTFDNQTFDNQTFDHQTCNHQTTYGYKYVGNRFSHKFHRPSCPFAQLMSGGNVEYFCYRKQAIEQGFKPCRYCLPPWWKSVNATIIKIDGNKADNTVYGDNKELAKDTEPSGNKQIVKNTSEVIDVPALNRP